MSTETDMEQRRVEAALDAGDRHCMECGCDYFEDSVIDANPDDDPERCPACGSDDTLIAV